ncbi:MAG: hypothetical protein ACNYZG_06200, partial [Gammaproteobacteria bacterium]
ATSANAINLGEYWAVDQIGGVAHIFNQADLNDPTIDAVESKVDLAAPGAHNSVRMHILGFSNHAGIDPSSRTIMTYLDGWMEIWKSNGGTGAPEEVAELQASTTAAYNGEDGMPGNKTGPDKGNTSHACGGNPQNDQIQCASIFNGDFTLFEADMATDTYTRIGIYRTGDLKLSHKLKGKVKKKVKAAYKAMLAIDSNPNNICSQYDTSGNLLYIAAQTSPNTGGVIVVDVSDASNPTILDAYNDVMAAGCGLVNHPDGKHLWITHGFNKQGDPEEVSIWAYANAGKKNGPVDRVALPTDDSQAVYGGDAHGAQFAGLTSGYLWQVMRIDDTVQIISASDGANGTLVNEINLEDATGRTNVQPDVIDRSAFGTRMYWTTRGPRPSSAIGSSAGGANRYNHVDRQAGVDVFATLFGYGGVYTKSEIMENGGVVYLCDKGGNYDEQCASTDDGAVQVTSSDPHGSKSLNYLTGF